MLSLALAELEKKTKKTVTIEALMLVGSVSHKELVGVLWLKTKGI